MNFVIIFRCEHPGAPLTRALAPFKGIIDEPLPGKHGQPYLGSQYPAKLESQVGL